MGMSVDELFDSLERERASRPWYKKMYDSITSTFYHIPVYHVEGKYYIYKNAYQRSKKGYGHRDFWDIGIYLSDMIAEACLDFGRHGYTYPGEGRGFTPQSWKEFLFDISYDIICYTHLYKNLDSLYPRGPEGDEARDILIEDMDEKKIRATFAIQRFAQYFEHIGD